MTWTTLPVWTVEPVTGADLAAMCTATAELRPVFARKTADETVNNSAVMQNDNHLFLPVAANTVYRLSMRLGISSGATPDFKTAFTFPAGTTMFYNATTVAVSTATLQNYGLDQTSTASIEGGQTSVTYDGLVIVSAAGGTLQLQWAQNTANASDTKVLAGSYIELRKAE